MNSNVDIVFASSDDDKEITQRFCNEAYGASLNLSYLETFNLKRDTNLLSN